jgi:hypothetical protein
MKANTLSPMEIFGNQIRYVVPLYQRPYVWNKNDQWEPLWEDVRTLAERVLEHPGGYGVPPVASHFLGAIVLDQQLNSVNLIGSRAVIDGQQRLTTLQLLLDAAQVVVAKRGRPMDAESMRVLIANNEAMVSDKDHVFKVWPTDRDQAAFRASMRDDLQPDGVQAASGIAKAHSYFEAAVDTWATEHSESTTEERLGALAEALRQHLRLVVIDLEPGDNAQVIFETLNHRGVPLLAADLIKNLVFQMAESKGLDSDALYATYWKELDSDYWRQVVAQGRLFRPRIDVFVHRWLTMMLRREVKVDRVFTDFRDEVMLRPDVDVEAELKRLSADAAVHRSWESLPQQSVAGLFRYRVLQALDSQVFAPVFLWLTRFSEDEMPTAQQEKALRALESWVVRRTLARVTTKDYNNLVVDLLTALDEAGPAVAGDTTEAFLAGSGAESRFWPSDERVSSNLTTEKVYRTMTRARVRMVLEALEDAARSDLGEGQPAPRNLTIEHVMPQAWREHWDDGAGSDVARSNNRDALIQTLGNLSLVTGRLNPTLSNRPWTDAEAASQNPAHKGKRDYLLKHSQLKLNAVLVHENSDSWTEEDIKERTAESIATLLSIWPAPASAVQPASSTTVARDEAASELDSSEGAWTSDDRAVDDARRLWAGISPVADKLLTILISVSPEQIGADDLAEALEIDTGVRGVAGVLSGIATKATALGRAFPIMWQEGEPSIYWVESGTAETLRAGKRSPSTDRDDSPRSRLTVPGDLAELVARGVVRAGDRLVHVRPVVGDSFNARVTASGSIVTDLGEYESPSPALSELVGNSRNGWKDWTHEPTGQTLAELRAPLT